MLPITGYAERWSAKPGETIRFMVGVQGGGRFRARVARIHCADPNPEGPGYREVPMPCAIDGEHDGLEQAVRLGSWVDIPMLDLGPPGRALTLAATIWPTLVRGSHAVLSWAGAGGVSITLGVAADGAFCRLTSAGAVTVVTTGVALTDRAWHDVECVLDATSGTIRIAQRPHRPRLDRDEAASAGSTLPTGFVAAGAGATAIAARRDAALAIDHFNGKIERPRILADGAILAAWDFALGIGTDTVTDTGPARAHGHCVNLPTRAMTGSNWTGDRQRWTDAPEQWGAIHFHDDDIGDAGWVPALALTIPDGWPSGLYALHLESGPHRDNIPFYVRASTAGSQAKVAFVAPTFSYTVYGQFARPGRHAAIQERAAAWGALAQSPDGHPEYGLSTYNWHSDGSGVAHASMRRPMVDKRVNHFEIMDPSPGGSGCYWIAADSYILDMLDRARVDYEVITDHDLHGEGVGLLAAFDVVLTGQHPEYHSVETLDAIAGYLAQGGRFLYLGGNGFYWKTVPHGTGPWALEVRRAEGGIRLWATEPGESYHAFDGSYGGLWRRLGRPPQSIVGIGFSTQGEYRGYPYAFTDAILDPRVAFLRDGMEAAATPGATFGERGFMGGGAAGHELDRADVALGTPQHALVVATAIVTDPSYALVNEERYDHTLWPRTHDQVMRADLTFFETPNGGAVLSFGSMNYIGALPVDDYANPAARLVLNAIRRFRDPAPLLPAIQV